MSHLLRSLSLVHEFIDSAVRYGLLTPDSVNVNRWGSIDVQVSDISAWASYCDDAEPALNKPGTLLEFTWTDDDGIRFLIYSGAPMRAEAVS
jgi:hypothetical protein